MGFALSDEVYGGQSENLYISAVRCICKDSSIQFRKNMDAETSLGERPPEVVAPHIDCRPGRQAALGLPTIHSHTNDDHSYFVADQVWFKHNLYVYNSHKGDATGDIDTM